MLSVAALNHLAKRLSRLTLVWIKAHVGHPENEIADELARRATKFEHCKVIRRSVAQNKAALKEAIYTVWAEKWESEPTCKQTRQFFRNPCSKTIKLLLKMARSQLLILKLTLLFFRMPPHRRVNGGLGDQPGVTIPGTTFSHPGQGSMKTTSMPML